MRRRSYGRLRRLWAYEGRLRQPTRRGCLLTWPTSLEIRQPSCAKRSRICVSCARTFI